MGAVQTRAQQRRLILALGALMLAALAGAFVGYRSARSRDLIVNGVQVAGVPLGGLNAAAARVVLEARLEYKLQHAVQIRWGQDQVFLEPWQADITLDIEDAVQQALAVGSEGSIWRQISTRLQVPRLGREVPIRAVGSEKLDEALTGIEESIEKEARDATLEVAADGTVNVIPSIQGVQVDGAKLKEDVLAAVVNADDRQVFVPIEIVEPEISTADAEAWGVKKVMTRFSTRFKLDDENRSHNIAVAAKALNNSVVAPGGEFSFNGQVGPRLGSLGYRDAPVIVDGELVPDVGGGVCQVSTTLYNAVLLANLQVEKRVPHTIPATYVDLGRDATVAYDYIDFRFTNSLQSHVYIKADVAGDKLTITLLGPAAAPKINLVSRIEEILPPETKEVMDAALPAGTRVIDKEGVKGFVVTVWRVTGEGETAQEELVGKTTYKARPTIVRVGPPLSD